MNTRIDSRGYPAFDVLGHFPDKVSADIALAEYTQNPYKLDERKLTFAQVYERYYRDEAIESIKIRP